MRMQNTEMEFVTFDAQDVITTSGPVSTPKSLIVQINTIRQYNLQYGNDMLYNTSGILSGGLDPKQQQHPTKGEWWLYYEGGQADIQPTQSNDAYLYLRAAEGSATDKKGSADYANNTVQDIIDWLRYNRGQ